MKILVVGGGSGGHITPAVATVREILNLRPRARIEFWTDRKYYKNVVKLTTEIGMGWGAEDKIGGYKNHYIRVRKIAAGKFHRYANRKFRDYLADFGWTLKEIVGKNIIGFIGFSLGFWQSLARLMPKSQRPDVIFLKGGFVGMPVGMVARILNIPYVIHESDAVPGLANRFLMKRAKVVAMGVPFDLPDEQDQSDEAKKIRKKRANWEWAGIPVGLEFKKVSATKQASLKKAMGFDPEKTLVMITGGSQGSEHINQATREILPELLKSVSVGLVAGQKHYEEMMDLKKYEEWDKAKLQSNFRLWNFSSVMHELLGAADIVVSRAGATTIAELATLKKTVILVPFEKLPGGHQVKNAEKLQKKDAVEVLRDDKMMQKPEKLLEMIKTLSRSPKRRQDLAENLQAIAKVDAAKRLAEIVVNVGKVSKE